MQGLEALITIGTSQYGARAASVPDADRARRTRVLILSLLAVAVVAAWLLSIAESGVAGTDRANPNPAATYVYDGVPRAHAPFWGIEDWPAVFQILSVGLNVICWVPFVWIWWKRGRVHPGLMLMFALWFACSATDPLANWGYAANYDPRVLHFPVDWPYVSLAPLVEPIVAVAGWQWWYMLPGLIGFAMWKRRSRRSPETAWVNRRPLLSLFLYGFGVGAVIDVAAEVLFIKSMIYMYSQFKGPALWGGHSWQFPIVWGPLLQLFLYGLTAMFLWRDDQGRTVCGRLVARSRRLRRKPVFAEFAVATALLTAGYLVGIGTMAVLKQSATTVARPWPFPDAKTYDPTGLWERRSEPGPFMDGVWSDGPF